MPKPEPIQYSLRSWEIRYDERDYDGTYLTTVVWDTGLGGIKSKVISEHFNTFHAAVKWIESETGIAPYPVEEEL